MSTKARSGAATSAIDTVEKLLVKRKWILKELQKFEEKFGMTSREFYEAWSKGLLPEPEDPEVHGDFMVWAGLIEELKTLEKELIEKIKE